MRHKCGMRGEITFTTKKTNKIIRRKTIRNLIVANGGIHVAARMAGVTLPLDSIAIGSGTTPATTADTTVETQVAVDNDVFGPVTGSGTEANTIIITATISAYTWTGFYTEAALSADGVLFSRAVFPAEEIEEGSYVEIIWKIIFTGA